MISSFCGDNPCVQVDPAPGGGVYVLRRLDGDWCGTVRLRFSPAEWDAFIAGAKNGEFDRERVHGVDQ